MNDQQPAVELMKLTRRFGKVTAVNAVTLTVPRGTTLGLLGPNGAGKSTTMRMLMGMLRPSSGSVRVLGMDVFEFGPQVKQRVGYVPESQHIYRWMTVGQVVRFARAMYASWNDDLATDLLDMFKLPVKQRVRGLSRGMLAKLSLLVATAHEPELLVLDEPLSGLDPIARDEFIDGVLQGICNAERTVIFSSHQLDEVNRLADTVAIMNAGRILVHRPMDELLSSVRRVRATLQDGRIPTAPPANTIWQHVNRREWLLTIDAFSQDVVDAIRAENPVENIEVYNLSLDDVFKDFVRGETLAC